MTSPSVDTLSDCPMDVKIKDASELSLCLGLLAKEYYDVRVLRIRTCYSLLRQKQTRILGCPDAVRLGKYVWYTHARVHGEGHGHVGGFIDELVDESASWVT